VCASVVEICGECQFASNFFAISVVFVETLDEKETSKQCGIMLNKHRPSLASALKLLTAVADDKFHLILHPFTYLYVSSRKEEREMERCGKTIKFASFIRNEMEGNE
jgi:hypothetical protein